METNQKSMKFINDLNKLVNTIDKVDKMLTINPKPQIKRKSYKEECEILKEENRKLRYQIDKLKSLLEQQSN